MRHLPFRAELAAVLSVAALGCSCERTPPPPPADEPLPGPLPGWEEQFDGITCRHPPVEANCKDGWCRIPSGCFIKGSPPDEWGHPAYTENQVAVILTHTFWVQQHEVTQDQWTAMGLHNPSAPHLNAEGGDCTNDPRCPVGNVTWFEAVAFANIMSERHDPPLAPCYTLEGCTAELGHGMACESATLTAPTLYDCRGFRLPTDAEWEYAIRASTRTAFYSGDIVKPDGGAYGVCEFYEHLDRSAWYCVNSGDWTHCVGEKRPNAWHLYDMMGNAREWVHDVYTGNPPPLGPLTDPGGDLRTYERRKTRGGSAIGWPTLLRSASRLESDWDWRAPTYGFRLARTE